jgi:hypothetical protein
MKTLLWLDDKRNPFKMDWIERFSPIGIDVNIIWVKSVNSFIKYIYKFGLPDAICFDHDLGDNNIPEKTGYTAANWLMNYCMDNDKKLPLYNIQSDNTVGAENIDKLLKNYKKHCE